MRPSSITSVITASVTLLSTPIAAQSRPNQNANFYVGDGSNFGIPGNATYDYVVVGGGVGGLATAMRLAESGTYTVAIIEAGGFYQLESGNKSVVPFYNAEFAALQDPLHDPLIDWGFVTTPQAGANNRTLHYARGKTLGGCSALNANIYNRGTRGTYQRWAELVGDDSYTFDSWVPYFARGLNYTEPNAALRAPNASVPALPANSSIVDPNGGPAHLTLSNYALAWSSWAQLAFQSFGFRNVSSFFGGELIGSQHAASFLNPETNERESSQTSYLQAALTSNRTNLIIYTHSLATKINFSQNKTATGVQVRSGRLDYTLSARKEVIVSAGAFQSPQLLMVSGVGPAATLANYNISLVADRPGVGQNMWDHIDVSVTWKVDLITGNSVINPILAQQQKDAFHTRPPVSIYGTYTVDYIGWEKLPNATRQNLSSSTRADLAAFPADWPEVEYEIASQVMSGIPGDSGGYGTFVVVPVAPTSRGVVSLISNSMLDPPSIDPRWLTTETDMEVVLQAVKRGRDLVSSAATAPVRLGDDFFQGGSMNITDANLKEYIKNNFFMNWHAACTCKMGRTNDTMAVVDSRARVIGVQNLRVVDASAFALLPPGHPMSTVLGLAEKISADIVATRG